MSAKKNLRKKESASGGIMKSIIKDDIRDISNYVVHDLIIPGTRNALYDLITKGTKEMSSAVTQAAKRALYGENGRPPSSSKWDRSQTSYSDYYSGGYSSYSSYNGGKIDIHNLPALSTKAGAISVIDEMADEADRFGAVRVAALYDKLSNSLHTSFSCPWTYNSMGWDKEDVAMFTLSESRDGWVIGVPDPTPLRNIR